MFSINDQNYDPLIDQERLLERLSQNSKLDVLKVNWCHETKQVKDYLEVDLPLVRFAKSQGFSVQLMMPIKLAIKFSEHDPLVVFCGLTNNPFNFDLVKYCFKSQGSHQ